LTREGRYGKVRTEASILSWTCGLKLKERKRKMNESGNCWVWNQSVNQFGYQDMWFEHAERKDDDSERCMTMEVDGTRQRQRPSKTL